MTSTPTLHDRFVSSLPADPTEGNHPRPVRGACFSRVEPARASAPKLIAHSREVAELLGLSDDDVRAEWFVEAMAGNRRLEGGDPYAMCYGGHQFGNWAGQLGDGRAINLGEIVGTDGEHWTLQLKGAGPTPYSRSGDGYAVLRSSVREFLCSEAMHHLGVPTTRALSLVTTGDQVLRDMFYDGNAQREPGAVVCRVARSFVRFGSFQILAAQQDEAGLAALRDLADTTIRWHYPELGDPAGDPSVYGKLFDEVCTRTVHMIVEWMRVGFVHGVMNTDNMSVLGETIDYGPYGWLDDYDPDWTPNTTDAAQRRYRFGHQPQIAQWNLAQFGSALVPLIGDVAPLQEALNDYPKRFAAAWGAMMSAKLGLTDMRAGDEDLVGEWVEILQATETDMTLAYRALARPLDEDALAGQLDDAYYKPDDVTQELRERTVAWLRRYRERLAAEGSTLQPDRAARMNAVNPIYVPRNYLAQLAIDEAEKGDASKVLELLDAFRRPYEERAGCEHLAGKRPDWARTRPGCSMLSCSS